MSQITTHVLDTAVGKPAEGLRLSLSQLVDGQWNQLGKGTTNCDGRVSDLLVEDSVVGSRALQSVLYY